jgi:hypothetical protein
MSTLLNQAIVEAETLREAALKSAEAAVIDKYSSQIKEAVEQLLEQDDEDFYAPDLPAEGGESALVDNVPTAGEESGELCFCPDEEEKEEVDAEPTGEETIELDLDKILESLSEGGDKGYGKSPEAFTGDEEEEKEEIEDVEGEKALEEDIELEEAALEESLTVDIEPTKSGWAGTPEKIVQHQAKQMLAMLQSSEHREDFEAINKAVAGLQNENKDLQKTIDDTAKKLKNKETRIQKLTEAVGMMKEILEESNVVNARLLYKVRVLENNSLNERQKSQVVEKLSEAKSVEEAKLIFETLQSSVGSTKRHPESLSEAVERSSSAMLLSRKGEATPDGQAPALDRWQRLAGLK